MFSRVSHALRALESRDLRIFFVGQGVSMIGTMMQQVAMAWLVYRLTGSTVLLGVMAMMSQAPSIVMAPLAGAIADRWSRYRMVWVAQVLLFVQALVVAVLVLTDAVQVWHLLVLSFILGIAAGIDIPSRQSLLVRLVVKPDNLPNAIALNSSMFNAARLVGPGVGGLAIAWLGEGPVFLINAISYVAIFGALAAISPRERADRSAGSVLESLREGLSYARRFVPVRTALFFLAGVALLGVPYVVLLPVFARDVLGGDALTLGLLTSASGFGALVGALLLASRGSVLGLGRLSGICGIAYGAALVLLGLSSWLWASVALLVAIGFGILVVTASINTILQTLVPEEMRARVMSLYTVAFVGASAIGSFFGGAVAEVAGAPLAVGAGGVGSILLGIWFLRQLPALRKQVHPVYARMGILPELARGVNRASELRPRG